MTQNIQYHDNYIYELTGTRILIPGGYIMKQGNTYTYHYYVTDYQGNVWAVIDESGNLEEANDYYPYDMLMTDDSGNIPNVQRFKYAAKEYETYQGLNIYDFGARCLNPAAMTFTTSDPMCEKYYSISPYTYCAGNPVMYIDPDGRKVTLYATTIPGSDSWVINKATHTFITVETGNNKYYFAYGYDGDIKDAFLGKRLQKESYKQDRDIIEGKNKKDLKNKIEIYPPKGMTSEEFDQTVINVANSFGDNPEIKYNLLPDSETQGNCNSSSYTILYKSGVPQDQLKQIGKQLSGITSGWGHRTAWTKKEQKDAVKIEKETRKEVINRALGH